jgi:hypothetical protein
MTYASEEHIAAIFKVKPTSTLEMEVASFSEKW